MTVGIYAPGLVAPGALRKKYTSLFMFFHLVCCTPCCTLGQYMHSLRRQTKVHVCRLIKTTEGSPCHLDDQCLRTTVPTGHHNNAAIDRCFSGTIATMHEDI